MICEPLHKGFLRRTLHSLSWGFSSSSLFCSVLFFLCRAAMAVSSSSRPRTTDLQLMNRIKEKDRDTSPERTKVWSEPPSKLRTDRKVPVVYYLCRNGQLEHPHFMEVPLSSPEGLYLRDVIDRLNFLRGKGMAAMYSWSSKRSYKNGFVWHDLSDNDFIYPAHGQEYVLKGSELLDGALICKSDDTVTTSSSFRKPPPESPKPGNDGDFPALTRRRNQSWSATDFKDYKVYKAELAGRAAADAATQTDDRRRRRRPIREVEEEEEDGDKEEGNRKEQCEENRQQSTELSRDEISPPPSDSSPETLESLMKADGRVILCPGAMNEDRTADKHPSGRLKASSVLMQLISCGSISFKDCGPTYVKEAGPGFSLVSHYKARLPRGGGANQDRVEKEAGEATVEIPNFSGRIKVGVEDKEYFSGSLIETKRDQVPTLKRSSSYNSDRTSHLETREKEMDGARAKCMQRKPKTKGEGSHNEAACRGTTTIRRKAIVQS